MNNVTYINIHNGRILDMNNIFMKNNSLLKVYPLAWEELNTDIYNDEFIYGITHGSSKKLSFKCRKCNSDYTMEAHSKKRGRGCPYCSGKKVNESNSLSKNIPEVAKLWDYEKNTLTPDEITYGSDKKVWWKCLLCNNSHITKVRDKVKSSGCPYCSNHRINYENSLLENNRNLAEEWDYEKNKGLLPSAVAPNSHIKVWWKPACKHSFKAMIKSRNKGSKCPYCLGKKVLKGFNDINTTNKILSLQLLNPRDGDVYTEFSHKRIDWKCAKCNNIIYNKKISDVNVYGLSCEACCTKTSFPERMVANFLKEINLKYEKEKVLVNEGMKSKRYDFYLKELSLIIEVHGRQHYSLGFECLGGRSLEEEQKNDKIKHLMAIENGILNYIIIDASKSSFEFIKSSIIKSGLLKIVNVDKNDVNWDLIKDRTMLK